MADDLSDDEFRASRSIATKLTGDVRYGETYTILIDYKIGDIANADVVIGQDWDPSRGYWVRRGKIVRIITTFDGCKICCIDLDP